MSNWIEEHNRVLTTYIKANILSPQLCGSVSAAQCAAIEEDLDGRIIVKSEVDRHEEGELLKAIGADVIWTVDNKFIDTFLAKPTERHVMDLRAMEVPEEDNWVGGKLHLIADKMSEIVNGFSSGESFFICSPLMISILQSASKDDFKPILDGFQGPNNTNLVGELRGTPVYSFLFGSNKYIEFSDDVVIVGCHHALGDECEAHIISLYHLEFA